MLFVMGSTSSLVDFSKSSASFLPFLAKSDAERQWSAWRKLAILAAGTIGAWALLMLGASLAF